MKKRYIVIGGGGGSSNIISGFTLSNLTNAQLDSYVFNNCTFLTANSSIGHHYQLSGANVIYSAGGDQYADGIGTSAGLDTQVNNATGTFTLGGAFIEAGVGAYASAGGSSSCTVTTAQTGSLRGGMSATDDTTASGVVSASYVANNALGYTCLGIGTGAVLGSALSVSVTSALALDFSACSLFGIGSSDTWSLTAGSESTPIIMSASVVMAGNTDTWTMGLATSTDAILAAYAAGGSTSGTLNLSPNATLGTLDPNYITCIANGLTVTGIS